MTTPRTAASSDARKRLAEAGGVIDVKVTVDTDELREWAGKHADAGQAGVAHVLYATARELETGNVPAFLDGGDQSPPPVPREPWHDLSTDREKPTLAKVTWVGHGDVTGTFVAEVYCYEDLHGQACVEFADGHNGTFAVSRDFVTSVTLLSTHDPVTQVPVDRALVEQVAATGITARRLREAGLFGIATAIDRLATLADAAVSKDADR